jgi:hypothetical protein
VLRKPNIPPNRSVAGGCSAAQPVPSVHEDTRSDVRKCDGVGRAGSRYDDPFPPLKVETRVRTPLGLPEGTSEGAHLFGRRQLVDALSHSGARFRTNPPMSGECWVPPRQRRLRNPKVVGTAADPLLQASLDFLCVMCVGSDLGSAHLLVIERSC